jgi:hypothetical protein
MRPTPREKDNQGPWPSMQADWRGSDVLPFYLLGKRRRANHGEAQTRDPKRNPGHLAKPGRVMVAL